MCMVHYHSAHPLVCLLLLVVPEPNIHWTVVLLVFLVEIYALLDVLGLIKLLAGTNQVKAVHVACTFSKPLITHFKLNFVP